MSNQIINHAIVVGQDEMNREYLNEVFAELTSQVESQAEGQVDWDTFELSIYRSYMGTLTLRAFSGLRADYFEIHATVLAVTEDDDE